MKINFIDMGEGINKTLQDRSAWRDCKRGDVVVSESGNMFIFIEKVTVSGAKVMKISKRIMEYHIGTAEKKVKKIGEVKI